MIYWITATSVACLFVDHPLAAWLLEDPFFDQPPCWRHF